MSKVSVLSKGNKASLDPSVQNLVKPVFTENKISVSALQQPSRKIRRAAAYWKANKYQPHTPQWLKDLSEDGNRHLGFGGTRRADIINGELQWTGINTARAEIGDHPDLRIVADMTVVFEGALESWNAAVQSQQFGGKWTSSDPNRGYRFYTTTTGFPRLEWSSDGTGVGVVLATGTQAVPFVNGQRAAVMATLDVDGNGGAGWLVRFYISSSADGPWTPLGDPVTGAGVASVHPSTVAFPVGSNDGSSSPSGRAARLRVHNGFFDGVTQAGAVVLDVNFANKKDGTPWFDEVTGKRVTIKQNRSVILDGALWLTGTAGHYAMTADHSTLDLTGDFEIVGRVTADRWASGVDMTIAAKWGANTGYMLRLDANGKVKVGVNAFTANVSTVALPLVNGVTAWIKGTWRASDGRIQFWYATTANEPTSSQWIKLGGDVTAVSALSVNTQTLRVGQRSDANSDMWIGKIHRVIVRNGIDGPAVFDVDFSTWKDGQGMEGIPSVDSTGKAVLVISDTTGVEGSDPKFLPQTTDQYAYFPGVGGNYLSHSGALNWSGKAAGTVEYVARVSSDDWTPGATSAILGTHASLGRLQINTGGFLQYVARNEVAAGATASSTALPFVDGAVYWVRAVHDIVAQTVTFYISSTDTNDPAAVVWTQHGAPVAIALVSFSVSATWSNAVVGQADTGSASPLTGRVYRAIWKTDGATTLDLDINAAASPYANVNAVGGQVFSVNRPVSGRKIIFVNRRIFLLGTDDYMRAASHAALNFGIGDSFVVLIAARIHGTTNSEELIFKKNEAGTTAGYCLLRDNGGTVGSFRIGDGAIGVSDATPNFTSGVMQVLAGRRSVSLDQIEAFDDGVGSGSPTPDTTTATLSNNLSFYIGRDGAGVGYGDFEFLGAAVIPWDATVAEVAEISADLLAA